MGEEKRKLDGEEARTAQSVTEPTGDAPGSGADNGESEDSGKGEVTFTAEQQAMLDKIISERLARQREKLEAEAKAAEEKARREADEARLAEQQKFQELADKRKGKIEELEPALASTRERLERYEKALGDYAQAAMEGVPDYVKALLERMDPVEQLGYLREHREAFAQGSEGPPKTPKAKGSGDLSEDEARSRAWNVRHGGF